MKIASKDKFLLSSVMVFPPALASQNCTIAELERWLTQQLKIHTALAEDLNADPNTMPGCSQSPVTAASVDLVISSL